MLFFPLLLNAPREAFPPSRWFDVTGVRLCTWTVKCRDSLSELRSPPPSSSSYLPASLDDRQPAAHRPAAVRCPVFSLRARASGFFLPSSSSRISTDRLSEFGRAWEKSTSSLRALFSSCPSRHGENGKTPSFKPNFSAADSRRTEIPAGKPAEAAFPSR